MTRARLLFFGNNWLGATTLQWLREHPDTDVVGAVLHQPERRSHQAELARAAHGLPTFDAAELQTPRILKALAALAPDVGLSVLFGYLLRKPTLDLFPQGVLNLHPALLPYNRGSCPNVWSIVEGTPAGVTLHYMDEGLDTGDVVAQREVPVDATDTGESLYRKLERAGLALLKSEWPALLGGSPARFPQDASSATTHTLRDLDALDRLDLDRSYTARELINILRARTFPPHRGAYFLAGERRIYLSLRLEEDVPQ